MTPKRARRSAKRQKKVENNGKNNGAPSRVAQRHGGELNAGGTPGNKGGTGRPPNVLRELCRKSGYEGVMYARKVLAGKVPKCGPLVRLKAADLVLKYGLGTRVEVETPQTPVSFSFLVSPEVAAERAAEGTSSDQG